jgi:pimeloyl-ACP methyl ester carboxylesterase
MSQQDSSTLIGYPFAAGGVVTRVLEAGEGPQTVLFVHGVGARADRWSRNLPVIAAAGYRCLAIDLPGHGFAHKGEGFAYGVKGYADFIEAFIESQGLDRVHLVGTSLGAHVVGTLVCRRPELAQSLSLVGAVGMLPLGEDLRGLIAQALVDTSLDGIRMKLAVVINDRSLIGERLVQEEWRVNNSPGAPESFSALADYFRVHLDDDVIGVKLAGSSALQRALLVWGEDDLSTPLVLGRQVGELLGLPVVGIPGTGHVPYWEAPAAFNQILLEHLRRHA